MTFSQKIYTFSRQNRLFADCTGCVLAVSGGPDSMAMLSVLSQDRGLYDFPFCVAHVNHRLRREADDEQSKLAVWCEAHNIPFYTKTVDISAECPEGVSTETFARDVRYAFFEETRTRLGYSHIATAHTADDNIETFFMHLCRGSGTHGLGGIQPLRDGHIVRPMLCVYKSEIIGYLTENNIPFATDKTNFENICTRNVFRNEILPLLRRINPSLSDAVLHTEHALREDDGYLKTLAEQAYKACKAKNGLSVPAVLSLPNALRHRIYTLAAGDLSFEKIRLLDALFSGSCPSARVTLSDTLTASRSYDTVVFRPVLDYMTFEPFTLAEGTFDLGTYTLTVTKVSEGAVLPFGAYTVRPRQEGDRICLYRKTGTKTVKKYFIEKKIPVKDRECVPVIEQGGYVMWVGLLGKSAEIQKIDEGYKPVLTKKYENL